MQFTLQEMATNFKEDEYYTLNAHELTSGERSPTVYSCIGEGRVQSNLNLACGSRVTEHTGNMT